MKWMMRYVQASVVALALFGLMFHPGLIAGFPVASTAWAEAPPDSDGDGLADTNDDCPNQFGAELMGGCPCYIGGDLDSDCDGVPDIADGYYGSESYDPGSGEEIGSANGDGSSGAGSSGGGHGGGGGGGGFPSGGGGNQETDDCVGVTCNWTAGSWVMHCQQIADDLWTAWMVEFTPQCVALGFGPDRILEQYLMGVAAEHPEATCIVASTGVLVLGVWKKGRAGQWISTGGRVAAAGCAIWILGG